VVRNMSNLDGIIQSLSIDKYEKPYVAIVIEVDGRLLRIRYLSPQTLLRKNHKMAG
jgi:hypothetical protein